MSKCRHSSCLGWRDFGESSLMWCLFACYLLMDVLLCILLVAKQKIIAPRSLWKSSETRGRLPCFRIPYWPWKVCGWGLGGAGNTNGDEGKKMIVRCVCLQWVRLQSHGWLAGLVMYFTEKRVWYVLEDHSMLQMKTNMGWALWDEMFAYCSRASGDILGYRVGKEVWEWFMV